MKLAIFNVKPYDRRFFEKANEKRHEITYLESRLDTESCKLAEGMDAICAFVNDDIGERVLESLAKLQVGIVALRCAGFNNVDLESAKRLGIRVVRVPAYSPHAVAEHTMALVLTLNRNIHRAFNRVRDGNFALDGLLGFDLYGKTVGIIGTGKIGELFARIALGFGCRIVAFDTRPNPECLELGVEYLVIEELFRQSDIISLHCPLTPNTHHLIDATAIELMKESVMIVNTSRGAVIDTQAVTAALKSRRIGSLALDVYEEEAELFFEDLSNRIIPDDTFTRLLTFPNVLITGHQGFFTQEALTAIAETTLKNLSDLEDSKECVNEIR
jgi:D-lactate dehydrogenase